VLFVPPPDGPARAGILRLLCHGKPMEDLDYDQLAKKTEHFSGADLKAVVDIAVESKLREAMKSACPSRSSQKICLPPPASRSRRRGMVRHGAKLRALLQSRRHLR
jgi:SpoVK/Ycf46/Vps4 family AAA+-type ATPase